MNSTLPRTSSTALASLIFGVLCWLVLPFVGAIAAIMLGHAARSEIRRSPVGVLQGNGMALVGIVLGWGNMVLATLVLVVLLPFIV